jgi:branched-chain amino acid transport system substrate-binding protein
VVAIVGPEYSKLAIPVGQIANDAQTPMIATTASNINVTRNRAFVFRISFVDSEQGPTMAALASSELNATTAAILYQEDDPYSNDLASSIKGFWEYLHGNGSVAAFVSFNQTNIENSDFAIQAAEIASVNKTATILFVPIHGEQVPDVVNAVRDAGWYGQIIGADAWENKAAIEKCGEACVGSYFSANFIAEGSVGYAKRFVDKYLTTYGVMPDAQAALAYDAMNLIKAGLEQNGNWTCDLAQDRAGLRMGMKDLTNFQGVAGDITFNENGDPIDKCIAIAHVSNTSSATFVYRYCPGTL